MPVDTRPDVPGAVMFRRHRWSAAVGAWALFSLVGAPFTPGAQLWLGVARALAAGHQPMLLAALALAWIVAVSVAVDSVRRAFGSPSADPAPSHAVPWPSRAALWCAAVGLALLFVRP